MAKVGNAAKQRHALKSCPKLPFLDTLSLFNHLTLFSSVPTCRVFVPFVLQFH
jgi:hypothetical protein